MSKSVFSSHRVVELLRMRFQIKMATEAITMRTIQKGQTFFSTSNVPSPPAMELPGPGVFGAPHCANTQSRGRRSVRQNKLAPERCVETGEPMRVGVNCSRKDYPLGSFITAQKIDSRIIPGDPCEDRQPDTCKGGYPNRSMPWLEKEHCDLNV